MDRSNRLDLRVFAVCSDTKVGKLRNAEDFNVYDVPIPVTTDPAKLLAEMSHRKRAKGLTVVFSTYQSLPVWPTPKPWALMSSIW